MKNRLLLVISAVLCWNGAAFAQTFDKVLGTKQVEAIVRNVTSDVVAEQSIKVNRKIVAVPSYINKAAQMVGEVETDLDPAAARWSLAGLYGTFATHVVQFAVTKVKGNITLDSEIIGTYMAQTRRRCGEAPCHMNCDPCNQKCNSCKP